MPPHSTDLDLKLDERPVTPLVLEGIGGLSRKDLGAGNASYYYSYPRLATNGTLRVGGRYVSGDGRKLVRPRIQHLVARAG